MKRQFQNICFSQQNFHVNCFNEMSKGISNDKPIKGIDHSKLKWAYLAF
jgi:hypothetical protein